MSDAQIMESAFEVELCAELGNRGWMYESNGNATVNGWDVATAMVQGDVLHWLSAQYTDEYEKAIPSDLANEQRDTAEKKLLAFIIKELGKTTKMDPNSGHPVGGLLGVLRKGFTYAQVGRPAAKFGPLMAFPPENAQVASAVERAQAVRLRVLRQVRFDTNTNESIDVVLTANGLPVVTMELKTDNTQSVNHAINQYMNDRVPGPTRALLRPGRALVHFAVSNDLVYMSTKLAGAETVFLPFNQGNDDHAGNPPSKHGSATDYLWREILDRRIFTRILKDFALFEPNRAKKNDGRLVFPRFHQLRAVERIVNTIDVNGPGGRYLVQHSAGSGKTKTIAWLSHRLIRLVGKNNESTFDSVIVVTDRTVLDENVRDDINHVQSSHGLVVNVGSTSGAKSPQLIQALAEGGHIITCTLQTFPALAKTLEAQPELRGRTWAVIADEAHSSQSGSSAKELKKLLVDVELDEDEDITADDLLAATDSAIAASSNITFIALTATPKGKTLRLFGTKVDGEDRWEAFDTYSMAQAIEEGFILDVLTNYSTYDMFLRVKKAVEDEDDLIDVETKRAVKDIARFGVLHPTAIAQKVQVVVEHFRANVAYLLGGQARAMVVTSSRKAAVEWSEKMNAYITENGYEGLDTLVAFSGSVKNEAGEDVTEISINERSNVATAFREEDEFKVLIVANKFQTGFDEPRLMAMYVDKKLSNVATVQTLSRLNRMLPGKPAPMVVDFVNTPEQIQADFLKYYKDAHVEGEVDANAVYTLRDRLDTAGIYTGEQAAVVASAYVEEKGGEAIQRALGPIKSEWSRQVREATFKSDKNAWDALKQFRSDIVSYRNAWQFLSQIVDYQDEDLRSLAVLTTLLARNLHLTPDSYDNSYMDGVLLSGVKLVPNEIKADYTLAGGGGATIELPNFETEARGSGEKPHGPLDEAIDKVNELFKERSVEIGPGSVKGFVTAFWGYLTTDAEADAMSRHNTVSQMTTSEGFTASVMNAMFQAFNDSDQMKAFIADPDMVKHLVEISAAALHARHSADDDTESHSGA